MGLIILFTFIAVSVAFVTGRMVAVYDSSDNDNDVLAFVVIMFFPYSECKSSYKCNIFIC